MNSVNDGQSAEASGPFEARYVAFLETISTLRPSLHRYCARMTGSASAPPSVGLLGRLSSCTAAVIRSMEITEYVRNGGVKKKRREI